MTIRPSAKSFATKGMPFEMTDQEVLADKGAVALIAAENARLIVIELVSKEMIRPRVALFASGRGENGIVKKIFSRVRAAEWHRSSEARSTYLCAAGLITCVPHLRRG